MPKKLFSLMADTVGDGSGTVDIVADYSEDPTPFMVTARSRSITAPAGLKTIW